MKQSSILVHHKVAEKIDYFNKGEQKILNKVLLEVEELDLKNKVRVFNGYVLADIIERIVEALLLGFTDFDCSGFERPQSRSNSYTYDTTVLVLEIRKGKFTGGRSFRGSVYPNSKANHGGSCLQMNTQERINDPELTYKYQIN